MSSKKVVCIVALAIMFGVLYVTESNAQVGFYTCTVNAAGPGWGSVYIELSSSGFSGAKWFTVSPGAENHVLAVALAAISNGMPVYAYIDPAATNPTIYTIYLLNQ